MDFPCPIEWSFWQCDIAQNIWSVWQSAVQQQTKSNTNAMLQYNPQTNMVPWKLKCVIDLKSQLLHAYV